jgi:hypothetical protein
MVHYFNPNPTPITANVALRLDYDDTGATQQHAAGVFLNDIGISVPGPGTVTRSRTYTMPYDMTFLGGASHMHKRGVGFIATTAANEVIYQGTQWDEPPPNTLLPPIFVPGGSKITVSCTYNNPSSTTYIFGESADLNEMCIYSGVFYPSPTKNSVTQHCTTNTTCAKTQ